MSDPARAVRASPSVMAYLLQGPGKLLSQGQGNRDGHLIEWFERHLTDSGPVVSRAEPRWPALASSAAWTWLGLGIRGRSCDHFARLRVLQHRGGS